MLRNFPKSDTSNNVKIIHCSTLHNTETMSPRSQPRYFGPIRICISRMRCGRHSHMTCQRMSRRVRSSIILRSSAPNTSIQVHIGLRSAIYGTLVGAACGGSTQSSPSLLARGVCLYIYPACLLDITIRYNEWLALTRAWTINTTCRWRYGASSVQDFISVLSVIVGVDLNTSDCPCYPVEACQDNYAIPGRQPNRQVPGSPTKEPQESGLSFPG